MRLSIKSVTVKSLTLEMRFWNVIIQETKVAIKNLTEFKSEELFGATITQLLGFVA